MTGMIEKLNSLLQKKKISCIELTRAYLNGIARDNGVLNAYVRVTEERALETAAVVDHKLAAGQILSAGRQNIPPVDRRLWSKAGSFLRLRFFQRQGGQGRRRGRKRSILRAGWKNNNALSSDNLSDVCFPLLFAAFQMMSIYKNNGCLISVKMLLKKIKLQLNGATKCRLFP